MSLPANELLKQKKSSSNKIIETIQRTGQGGVAPP